MTEKVLDSRNVREEHRIARPPTSKERMREQNMLEALKYLHREQFLDGRDNTIDVARLVPVRVWLPHADKESEEKIQAAIDQIVDSFGLLISHEFPEIRGSWFKTWIMWVRRAASTPEVAERLRKLERALELKALDIPQAQVDGKQAHAVAELLRALQSTPSARIQIGPLLIVKQPAAKGHAIYVRTLTPNDMLKLESDPSEFTSTGFLTALIEPLPQERPHHKTKKQEEGERADPS